MSDIINKFIGDYEEEFVFYEKLAELCAKKCKGKLDEMAIQNIVHRRAKRPDSLRKKIEKINIKSPFKTMDDIRKAIRDLAGVRIVLYMPSYEKEVGEMLKDIFNVNDEYMGVSNPKTHPDRKNTQNDREKHYRFSGYRATHYMVYMKISENLEERYSRVPIEVQVTSIIMHAWSEVDHDIVYKETVGSPSAGEREILDALNGLMLTGELLLDNLQRQIYKRLGNMDKLMESQFEMANFLKFYLESDNMPPRGRIDGLFATLKKFGMNSGGKLRPILDNLDLHKFPQSSGAKASIADQIIQQISKTKPSISDMYHQINSSLISGKSNDEHMKKKISRKFSEDDLEYKHKELIDILKKKIPDGISDCVSEDLFPDVLKDAHVIDGHLYKIIEDVFEEKNSYESHNKALSEIIDKYDVLISEMKMLKLPD